MRCWLFTSHWGPPCSDDPVSSSGRDLGLGRWPRGSVAGHHQDNSQVVPMKKDNEQAGGRYPLVHEMRISQLVLDPTSHADSKNLKAGVGKLKARSSSVLL